MITCGDLVDALSLYPRDTPAVVVMADSNTGEGCIVDAIGGAWMRPTNDTDVEVRYGDDGENSEGFTACAELLI